MGRDFGGSMQKVAELGDLVAGRGRRVEIGGEKVLLIRDGDTVRAYAAACPHAGGPLDEGAICQGRIVCPWHKGTFRVSDGALLEPPPLDALARYPVRVDDDGAVLVSPQRIEPAAFEQVPDPRSMVIIGAGAAGTAAAAALREFGFGGEITLIGREPGLPYDRTSLSKFVMSAEMPPDQAPALREPDFFRRQRIARIEAEVTGIDVKAKRMTLSNGHSLAYDAALIATGGVPKRPNLPGAELPGLYMLRDRADAAAILARVRKGARTVILGASFIGLEVASGLRAQGAEVAVVAPEPVPFGKQFGPRLGGMFKNLHEANGVVFHMDAQATRLEGTGRLETVVLENGTQLAADLVVAGVGVQPATGFISDLGLAEDGGIPVASTMRAAEGLYAAGDVALFPLPGRAEPVRIEHWRVAQQHARIAARNMLGGNETYAGVPFFWTYHYGKRFENLGHATSWDEVYIDGDMDAHRFVAFLVKEGLVAGVLGCQRERVTSVLAERMRAPLPAEEALLLAQRG